MSPVRFPLCLLLVCLVMPSVSSAKKRKKPLPAAAALSATLNTKQDEIQSCAERLALDRGARKAEIVTDVTINGAGQVLNTHITVTVDGGDGEQVRECVEKLIRAIKFPKNDAPIINIQRKWSMASQ